MRKGIFVVIVVALSIGSINAAQKSKTIVKKPTFDYGPGLCQKKGFHCIKVKRGQSWKRLFPDEKQRDLVQRINRTNTYLYVGKKLVVPDNLNTATLLSLSPFPTKIKSHNEKMIIINQDKLAWGAYNMDGSLVNWGAISSGKNHCPDIGKPCKTVTGIFQIFNKRNKNCRSNIFPIGRGGSRMPYCMFFYKGFAMHGSNEVIGRRASHGCVRLFIKDAKWLNHNFVDVATREGRPGTKVIVQKLMIHR